MNHQEVFTKVATHLLKQGRRALFAEKNGFRSCAYRGDNGTKCAVGCLIKDEFIHQSWKVVRCHEMM